MENEVPELKLTVNRTLTRIHAKVQCLPADSMVDWILYRNGTLLETKSTSGIHSWDLELANPSGVFQIVVSTTNKSKQVRSAKSMLLSYGMPKQESAPRKAKPARPNEYPPSFKALVFQEARKSFRQPEYSAWLLDNKPRAYSFADKLGYKTPIINSQPSTFADTALEEGTVVKPLTGVMSQGVFIISRNETIEVSTGKRYQDKNAVRSRMNQLIDDGTIRKNEWIRERLILSDISPNQPARDIKFYTFYGQVKLILETIRTSGVVRCWYDQFLNTINTGKYNKNLFPGNGVPLEYYDAAQKISLAVPSPFARIDFLAGAEGLVLNEITPKPGGSNQFADSVDRTLGEALISADARLRRDLLNGKVFDAFNQVRHES